MIAMSEKGEDLLADLPIYLHNDPTIQNLINAVGNECARLEDYLLSTRTELQPSEATGDLLAYWENFTGLPRSPSGVSETRRRTVLVTGIRRRYASSGGGWLALLNAVADGATWQHTENTDENGDYAGYELAFRVELEGDDYRVGVFQNMVQAITPAHIKVSEIDRAGVDTFRVGVSEVGDPI